jgi:hypothetical protein
MKARKTILSVVLFLLIGCTAVTSTEEPGETAVPPETDINLPEESIEIQPEEPIVIGTPETEPTPTEDDNKQVSEPVVVDLGAITPEPIGGEPIVQPAPGNPGVKAPVIQAMTDLSARLGVTMEDVQLVSLLEVTWRDGSLGCPEGGMNYIQVLTPGEQLILRVAGEDYYYHSGKGNVFAFCGDPQPPVENMQINPNQPPPPGQDN